MTIAKQKNLRISMYLLDFGLDLRISVNVCSIISVDRSDSELTADTSRFKRSSAMAHTPGYIRTALNYLFVPLLSLYPWLDFGNWGVKRKTSAKFGWANHCLTNSVPSSECLGCGPFRTR